VEWVVVRTKRPSPLPLEQNSQTGEMVLMRRNTDTDLVELEDTLARFPALVGSAPEAYWRERLAARRFAYVVRVTVTDPYATREWVEEAAIWNAERLRRHALNVWPRNDSACRGSSGMLCAYVSSCRLAADEDGEPRFIRWADDGLPSNRKELRDGRGKK
jgi:hypothetical protein